MTNSILHIESTKTKCLYIFFIIKIKELMDYLWFLCILIAFSLQCEIVTQKTHFLSVAVSRWHLSNKVLTVKQPAAS